jgi:superfamily II DNA or RNA helicase
MPLPKGIKPRKYQYDQFQLIREAMRKHNAVLAEGPTGSGKSVLMSLIVDSFEAMNKRWKLQRHLYFLVDELFLLEQFSDHLSKWNISHDIIGGGKREGRHVNIHVCTIQSLAKHPPKKEPAFFVVDECHFSTADRYMNLFNAHPNTKILGMTASPETGSGKGLAAKWEEGINIGNGIFDAMVESPTSMRDLTEQGFLSPIRYFGVPIKGIETLHMTAGEYKPGEVEELLRERGTFGDAITEMKKFPEIKNHILFFCKSVKSCYEIETILNSHGYTAEVLEGNLTKKLRKKVMKNFETAKTQILITCKMVLKGVDLPYLLMSVDLAPTPSRATQRQKVGRGTRPAPGKESFIYLDMVGNHRVFPNSDIYANIPWNFDSLKYNKKPNGTGEENVCPLCYALIPVGETKCPECGAEKKKVPKKEKPEKHLDGDLVEIVPVPLSEREGEEKAEIQASISKAIVDNDILALLEILRGLYSEKAIPYQLYYKLTEKEKVVDVPLVYRIQRTLNYKRGWTFFFQKTLKAQIEKKLQEE